MATAVAMRLVPAALLPRALSIIFSGIAVGTVVAVPLGSYLGGLYGWRSAFILIGMPALLFSTLLAFLVKDPARGRWDLAPAHAAHPLQSLGSEARKLWALPAYRCLILAGGLTTLSSYAIAMWNTSFLVRSHGMSLQHAGLLAGFICGGVAGIGALFSGWLSDHLTPRNPHWQVGIPVIGHLAALSALFAYLLWPQTVWMHLGDVPIPSAMLWCALYSFFAVWWVAPSYNLVTQLVPANRRGTAMALQTILSTLLGVGAGPLLAGLFSDALQPAYGIESLRYALLLVSLPVAGAVMLLIRTSGHAAQTRYVHVERAM